MWGVTCMPPLGWLRQVLAEPQPHSVDGVMVDKALEHIYFIAAPGLRYGVAAPGLYDGGCPWVKDDGLKVDGLKVDPWVMWVFCSVTWVTWVSCWLTRITPWKFPR